MKMNPRLSRALYRSFLRASHNGQYPQVFGRYGAMAFQQQQQSACATAGNQEDSLAVPSTPAHVRKCLKQCFTSASIELPAFEMLKYVNDQHALLPCFMDSKRQKNNQKEQVQDVLPIFEYDQVAALPGETIQTMFLAPRYAHLLLPQVLNSSSKQFLLRPQQGCSATVLKLLSHQYVVFSQPGQSQDESSKQVAAVAVTCVAGPRVDVEAEEMEEVILDPISDANVYTQYYDHDNSEDGKQEEQKQTAASSSLPDYKGIAASTTPLNKATSYSYKKDECEDYLYYNNAFAARQAAWTDTRQYILDLLTCALENMTSTTKSGEDGSTTKGSTDTNSLADTLVHNKANFGLPPLDAEAFSFWALRFVLAVDDYDARLYWLHHCRSTSERLEFVVKEVEAISENQRMDQEKKAQKAREQEEEQEEDDFSTPAVSFG